MEAPGRVERCSVPKSLKGGYDLSKRLSGVFGPLACISIHPTGLYVACGGPNGTQAWSLPNGNQIRTPMATGDRGPTQTVAWLDQPGNPTKGLVYGTGSGWLCVWTLVESEQETKFQEVHCIQLKGGPGASGREIVSIAYDALTSQLAVAHGLDVIHVFNINRQLLPESRPAPASTSISIPGHHPVAVFFGRAEAEGRSVWSIGRDDGRIIMMSNTRLTIALEESIGQAIGGACISPEQDTLAVDVSQGPRLFRITDGLTLLKNLTIPSRGQVPRNVNFHLEGSTAVVTGSDHGLVYILDRPTATEVDVLETGRTSPVQIVDAGRNKDGAAIIVCSHSDEHIGKNELQLWKKRGAAAYALQAPRGGTSTSGVSHHSGTAFNFLLGVCVCLLVLHIKVATHSHTSLTTLTLLQDLAMKWW